MCLLLIMCTMANNNGMHHRRRQRRRRQHDNDTTNYSQYSSVQFSSVQNRTEHMCLCICVSCIVWCYVAPSSNSHTLTRRHTHTPSSLSEKNQLSCTWIRREHALYHIVVDSFAAVFLFFCCRRCRCCNMYTYRKNMRPKQASTLRKSNPKPTFPFKVFPTITFFVSSVTIAFASHHFFVYGSLALVSHNFSLSQNRTEHQLKREKPQQQKSQKPTKRSNNGTWHHRRHRLLYRTQNIRYRSHLLPIPPFLLSAAFDVKIYTEIFISVFFIVNMEPVNRFYTACIPSTLHRHEISIYSMSLNT